MSAISPRAHGKRDKTTEYLGAARVKTIPGRMIRTHGYLFCTHCGGPAMAKADFAAIAGVDVRQLTAFLERRTVRPDVATRIRKFLQEVDE